MLPTANRIGAEISVSDTRKWFSPWGRPATAMELRSWHRPADQLSVHHAPRRKLFAIGPRSNAAGRRRDLGASTTGRCLLANNPVHYLQSALGQSGHRDDNIGGIDSWGTLMAYLPMPEGGGPHERWCASCKTPIKDEQRSVRIAFDHDPHGYRGLTGIYHVHCSRPFQSLAHALKVLSFRSF